MAISSNLKMIRSEPSQFATEFTVFYCKIIPNLYDVKCRKFLEEVKEELKNIRKWKLMVEDFVGKFTLMDIDFQKLALRCAYMYSYGVLNTSIVYREFSEHMKDKKSVFSQCFHSKTLKICCLGGGPGIEAVGVSKAIYDTVWKFTSENANSVVNVHVTVIDLCPGWENEVFEIVKVLNNDSTLFPSVKVHFHAEFFEADLLKPFQKHLKNIIRNSNVVTVVNLVNAVLEKRPADSIPELQNMMTTVIDCMPVDGRLFMLDAAGGFVFYQTAGVTSKYRSTFSQQMFKHKGYRLHPKTLKKLENAMNFRSFAENSTLFPTQMRKVSSCVWIKTCST